MGLRRAVKFEEGRSNWDNGFGIAIGVRELMV